MAWRLCDSIVKGEIDNRLKGRVVGRVWLEGRKDPVILSLEGNCQSDMAGCLLTFENPDPQPGEHVDLASPQEGVAGDITASRKVFTLDCSVEEAMMLGKEGKDIPKHKANCLYIEWFSTRNGRVVIESTTCKIKITDPLWRMSDSEYQQQAKTCRAAFLGWLEKLNELGDEEDVPAMEVPEDRPMDEFEWERFMKESDRTAEKFGELMEKYDGHPEADKLIAREMGWTWLEEELEAEERGIIETEGEEGEEIGGEGADGDEVEPLEPDPSTEGKDWVRDEDGDVQHPLALRAFKYAMRMWHYCDEHEMFKDGFDKTAQDMVFNMQICSAKLAGALNGLAYDNDVEPGFIIAGLKRALNYLHLSMKASDEVAQKKLIESTMLDAFRKDMFVLRESIVDLMREYRSQQSP